MKKIVIFALCIPLVGIIAFYWLPPSETPISQKNDSMPQTAKPTLGTAVQVEKKKGAAKAVPTVEELIRMEDELMAKAARLTDPKTERESVDFEMSRRESGYRALFDQWQLSDTVTQKIRTLIRERDLEQRLWILKPEASAPKTRMESNREKHGQKYLWDVKIADLIGDERLNALKKVDADVLAQFARDAKD